MNKKKEAHKMSRLTKIINMISEQRIGFKMDEIMSGTHRFAPEFGPEGEYLMEFKITWGPESIKEWINPKGKNFMTQPAEGTITIEGLCENTPCFGTLELKYLTEHKIRYTLAFETEGKDYLYIGEKQNIKPWNLHKSHTTCYGVVFDPEKGYLISESITHFRLRTMPSFIKSFRLE